LGLEVGDRLATLAWNTPHHFEIYFAAMGAGIVCHTVNPRFSADHLVSIINEAKDRALAVAADLAPLAAQILPHCLSIEQVIVLDEKAELDAAHQFEELLQQFRADLAVLVHLANERPDLPVGVLVDTVAEESLVLGQPGERSA